MKTDLESKKIKGAYAYINNDAFVLSKFHPLKSLAL